MVYGLAACRRVMVSKYLACISIIISFMRLKITPTSHIAISCESLSDPANGMVSLVSESTSLIAEYECNPGYYLTGNASRKCDCNGQWSGSDVTCEGIIIIGYGEAGLDPGI